MIQRDATRQYSRTCCHLPDEQAAHQFDRVPHFTGQERRHGLCYTKNRSGNIDPAADMLVYPLRTASAAMSGLCGVCFYPFEAEYQSG